MHSFRDALIMADYLPNLDFVTDSAATGYFRRHLDVNQTTRQQIERYDGENYLGVSTRVRVHYLGIFEKEIVAVHESSGLTLARHDLLRGEKGME